jgi:hypothetical protein
MMLIAVWKPCGFDAVDVMPQGKKFQSDYSLSNGLTPICDRIAPSGIELGTICDTCR